MSEPVIHHRASCSRPPETTWPIPDGGTKHGCPECDKYAITWDEPLEKVITQPEMTRRPVAAGYVCRDHHSQPVNFRGKGCKLCPTRKTNKRKAFGRSDYTDELETYR